MDYRRREEREDSPMYSRLFVICDRNLTEQDLRDAFEKYGTIEDIRIPLDQNKRPKGIAFIKYSKTSEAAKALDSLNLVQLPKSSRRLKVMVATNRSDIQCEDSNNDEKYRRLFLVVPKQMTENELEEYFSQFGKIESVQIQRDRDTNESKGLAFVKYRTFLEAALAIENCDRQYRCIFAQPKYNKRPEIAFSSNINNLAYSSTNIGSLISSISASPKGYTSVHFMCSPYLTQGHVEHLFDIVPGMVACQYFVDLMRNHGQGTVKYSNPVSAAHAVDKINHFEYPPGSRVYVKPVHKRFDENNFARLPEAVKKLKGAIASSSNTSTPDLAQLAQAIAEASQLIKAATGVGSESLPNTSDIKFCSADLPPPQPLADIDSPIAKRCFLVCKPQPPPLTALRDVFCRFGNLISVYTLTNKIVGYACYATAESADEAIRVLHGAEICGIRMKVLEAEEEVAPKRRRHDE